MSRRAQPWFFGARWSAWSLLLLGALALTGCPAPQTPYDKASEAARELNMAARWGRMDVAQGRASADDATGFARRHALWHTRVRIVDTELAGLRMEGPLHAVAEVEVSWVYDDDTTLRVTRLSQDWSAAGGRWVLESEKRVAGADGLFGETVERRELPEDTHFPTKVIH